MQEEFEKATGTLEGRYLAFCLHNEMYALPLTEVQEVIGYIEPTAIPKAPVHFKGVINLRGQVITIVDLRTKLKLEKIAPGAETSIVILDLGEVRMGMVVDSVESVINLEAAEIDVSPEVSSFSKENAFLGVAKKDQRLILLLDARRLFREEVSAGVKKEGTV